MRLRVDLMSGLCFFGQCYALQMSRELAACVKTRAHLHTFKLGCSNLCSQLLVAQCCKVANTLIIAGLGT